MRKCSIPGCEKPVKNKAKGWCAAHYGQWLRRGDPLAPKLPRGRTPKERPDTSRPCACGCGEMASGDTRRGRSGLYVSGHNARVAHPFEGKHHSEETRTALASYTGEQASSYRHGWSKTPTYVSWNAMRSRCRDESNASYPSYGGRGITVCDRWQLFENFLEDMGERPSLDHSIDRIDPDGNYEPGNCRWLTKAEQDARRRDPGGWVKKRAAGYVQPPPKPGIQRTARANECGHHDKPHYAKGMCKSCYRRSERRARKAAVV